MFEQMNWEEVYQLWTQSAYYFPNSLSLPPETERVPIACQEDECFYGYDWLECTQAAQRKQRIQTNLAGFIYFTKLTNKGTIHTLDLLSEARDDEERAAIWIAATASELKGAQYNSDVTRLAFQMHHAALRFLQNRFYLWHHAMQRLVPEILVPPMLIASLSKPDAQTVMQLIQMNTLMLKGSYRALLYSSLEEGAVPENHSLRRSDAELPGS